MPFWKMVGFVVTPTRLRSRISSARLPVRSRSRLRSSSQTATPASLSWRRGSVIVCLFSVAGRSVDAGGVRWCSSVARRATAGGTDLGQGGVCGGDHALGREAELLVEHVVGRAGAVVLQRDHLAGLADDVAP